MVSELDRIEAKYRDWLKLAIPWTLVPAMAIMSFPIAVAVHDVLETLSSGLTGLAFSIVSVLVSLGAIAFWCLEIWGIYFFVKSRGWGLIELP